MHYIYKIRTSILLTVMPVVAVIALLGFLVTTTPAGVDILGLHLTLLMALLFYVPVLGASLWLMLRLRVHVDAQGVRYEGSPIHRRRNFQWADVIRIESAPLVVFGSTKGTIFKVCLRGGRVLRVDDGWRGLNSFMPVDAAMPAFAEALRQFSPLSVEGPTTTAGSPFDPAVDELGKQAAQVSMLALALAAWAIVGFFLMRGAHVVELGWGPYYLRAVALLVAVWAVYHQRNIPGKHVIPLTTLLVAGGAWVASATLPLALLSFLPTQPAQFRVVDEDSRAQTLSCQSPAVRLVVNSHPSQRLLHKGQTVELAVQGGIFGVYLMPGEDYNKLTDTSRPVPIAEQQRYDAAIGKPAESPEAARGVLGKGSN